MGLRCDAAIVGYAEIKPERHSTKRAFTIEQWADLTKQALDDAGLKLSDVNGIVTPGVREASMFVPATVIEYLGIRTNFAETVDIGGADGAGMIWRAAAAIELGLCDVVVCCTPSSPIPEPPGGDALMRAYTGASSGSWGSPQAEFDIPYGNLAQNCGYAMIANRYAYEYGYDERALAKIAVDQRTNACGNPNAVFYGQPITVDDVLNSAMISDPLHMLEIVMPVQGGACVVVASKDIARRTRNRPVWIKGFGEHLSFKTPTYAPDLLKSPMVPCAEKAFAMSGVKPSELDMASLYDCYTITVLITIEDAGFCKKGEGIQFVREHDLTYKGDFPVNTHGGQLSFGQAGLAGGMSHVTEAARQIMHRAYANQVQKCDTVFVTGNGGILSEQVALVLQGD